MPVIFGCMHRCILLHNFSSSRGGRAGGHLATQLTLVLPIMTFLGRTHASKVSFLVWRRNHAAGQLSFATRSESRPRHASEGQLSGDELEGRLGWTRQAAGRRGQLCGQEMLCAGDRLVPASGAAVPMRELVFQQHVRLVGKKAEANDGVVDIWQIELSRSCKAGDTSRNGESMRK
jgi:hypothetical protein